MGLIQASESLVPENFSSCSQFTASEPQTIFFVCELGFSSHRNIFWALLLSSNGEKHFPSSRVMKLNPLELSK